MDAAVYPSYMASVSLKGPFCNDYDLSAVIMEQLSNFCFCNLLCTMCAQKLFLNVVR